MGNSVEFTETMRGHIKKDNYQAKLPLGDNKYDSDDRSTPTEFTLTIKIQDLDLFIQDPQLQAVAQGTLRVGEHSYSIEQGHFNLFTHADSSTDFDTSKEMHYTLFYTDEQNNKKTFYGFKKIEREDLTQMWQQTTTLYSTIWDGHHFYLSGERREIHATGILKISPKDFAKQLTTFESNASCNATKILTITKFLKLFSDNLWESYSPIIFGSDSKNWAHHVIPVRTTDGVQECQKEVVGFNTEDGLYLEATRFYKQGDKKDIILLLHGLTTSSDMFVMPEHYNITQYLLDHNMDEVWAFDWRGSNHYTYNLEPHRYNVDHIVQYDIPAVIDKIKEIKGKDVKIHVIAHCVGSLGFMCALAADKTTNIASVISNCVSLSPKVNWMAYIKLLFAPNFVEYVLGYPYVTPKLAYYPGPGFGKWIYHLFIRPFHRECHEPACHTISFMWGSGHPSAYQHENLSPVTHRRLADLFGGTSLNYYRHIFKMIKNGSSIPNQRKEDFSDLPENYLQNMKEVRNLPPILLVEGDKNNIFPHSNKKTFELLKNVVPNADIKFHEFKEYGHQDIFIGKNCAEDIFPTFIDFLKRVVNT